MLTITTNQQNPTFQQRTKMGGTSKIIQILKNTGMNSNHVIVGSVATTGAGAAAMLKPELFLNADAAKFGIMGGLASTVGFMFARTRTKKANPQQEAEMNREVNRKKMARKANKVAAMREKSKDLSESVTGCYHCDLIICPGHIHNVSLVNRAKRLDRRANRLEREIENDNTNKY